jgi:acyl-CoA reductase-like NAD-dependent aldehyde dehydrogenase
LDAGQVSVNVHAGAVRPELPFSGHKSSGIGVENGLWGLYEYTDLNVVLGTGEDERGARATGRFEV